MQAAFLNNDAILTSILGSTLLMGFFLVFLLSTRMQWLVKLFGGLENLYFWHRILAIATTAMIFIHQTLAYTNITASQSTILILGSPRDAGELARNGFILLVLIALMAKFLKYEHFRFIHRLLLIPYVFALYHSFYSSWVNLFTFDTLSLWMIFTSVVGLVSSIYMILIYQRTSFRFKGEIVEKIQLNESITELKIRMAKPYKMHPGQFAFIKINAKGISKAPHPFSISGQDGHFLYFTIKSLGDFTGMLKDHLDVPAKIRITKPFGDMTFKSSKERQIWIAGGIGVTPFLGYLRSQMPLVNDVHLYYSVKQENEAVHLDYLKELERTNSHFTFTLFEASSMGYLTAKHLPLDEKTHVYMCGPRPMALSLKKQLKKDHPYIPVDYEAFSFTGTLVEDILKTYKKVVKKLRSA